MAKSRADKTRHPAAAWADEFEAHLAGAALHRADRVEARRALLARIQDCAAADRRAQRRVSFPAASRRIVFFFGAGMSVPFGYPTTSGILARIWQGLHDDTKAGWRRWAGFRTGNLDRRQHDIRTFKRLLKSILPGLPRKGFDGTGASIVDVISMVEHAIMERVSPFNPESGKRRQVVAPQLELLTARHLLTLGINGVLQGRTELKRKQRFAEWLLRRATESKRARVSIISTNYDTTIDQALFNEVGDATALEVDMGITWRTTDGEYRSPNPSLNLAVLKLHGSLNWLRCETCGHVVVNTRTRIASLDAWRTKNRFNSCECGGLLKSLLVTPSLVRNIRDATLLSLWNAALEDLRLADEWVIIGYSLPSEDVAIRSLLLRAFHARRRKKLRIRVVLFDESDLLGENKSYLAYRHLFPEENFSPDDYSSEGGLEWLKRLVK